MTSVEGIEMDSNCPPTAVCRGVPVRIDHRKRGLCAWMLVSLAVCLTPARAAQLELPPLVQPPSQEHLVGKVIWVDLVTPDAARAKQFYGSLFGWTFRETQAKPEGYTNCIRSTRIGV